MQTLGNRVLLSVEKVITKNPDGSENLDIKKIGKVVLSDNEQLKKGDEVYFNPFGGIKVDHLETKKALFLVTDFEDIFLKL